jgi:nucleolysin TIA-1/TIAR
VGCFPDLGLLLHFIYIFHHISRVTSLLLQQMSDQPPPPPPPPPSAGGPPPPAASGAPGYDNQPPSHLPPPPIPPLSIPQNTNPIPTAISSPMNNGQKLMSPQSAGGFLRRAAPEPNKRALYVGGLDPRVTEDMLKQIFEAGNSHVLSVKIIPDKNVRIST